MAYDALTIDTNIAIQGGLNLDSGLLGQLSQFHAGQTKFVLSEIVVREIRKHLAHQVKKARDALISASIKARDAGLLEEESTETLKILLEPLRETKDIVETKLRRFTDNTGAWTIPAATASLEDLVRGYFAANPPFDATGAKKCEFPDAIALLSLEAWAKKYGRRVLAISQDAGWSAFAETSEFIDVEPDFAKALEILQGHVKNALARVSSILSRIVSGSLPQIAEATEYGLRSSLFTWSYEAEGQGAFILDSEGTELELTSFRPIKTEGTFDLRIVRLGSGEVVARVGARMAAVARATFSLSAYDSIDKDLVSLGSQTVQREVGFDGAFLLTLLGDFEGPIQDIVVHDVEVVQAVEEINFGEVSFDRDALDYDRWVT